MSRFSVAAVMEKDFEPDFWMTGEPGEITSYEQVADLNFELGMALSEMLITGEASLDFFDGKNVFHVVEGEGYFNDQNQKMAQRLMKSNIPFTLVTWRKC